MKIDSRFTKLFGYTLTIAILSSVALRADPPEHNQLPPGLAKKDKLPPGWQKKVGHSNQSSSNAPSASTSAATSPTPGAPAEVSKPSAPAKPAGTATPGETKPAPTTGTTSTSASAPTSKPLTRDQQERYTRLDRALADLETETARPGATDRVLARLSRLTETPLTKLRDQWKAHPEVSAAEFYLATQIASGKHITVEPVLAARKSGKSWGEIADEYRARTGELAQGLQGAKAAARDAADTAERKTQQVAK